MLKISAVAETTMMSAIASATRCWSAPAKQHLDSESRATCM
jgi:hypothetical protein